MMFKNITLTTRIILFSIFSIGAIILLVFVSLSNLNFINNNFKEVTLSNTKKVFLSNEIKYNLIAMRYAERNMILAANKNEADQYKQNFNDAKRDLIENTNTLKPLILEDDHNHLEQFNVNLEHYIRIFDEMTILLNQNQNGQKDTLKLSSTKAQEYILSAQKNIDLIVSHNEKTLNKIKLSSNEIYNDAVNHFFIITLATVVLLVFLSYQIFVYLNSTFSTMKEKIKIISNGEYALLDESTMERKNINSTDELSLINNSLIDIIMTLRSVALLSQSIANGDLNSRLKLRNQDDMVGISLNTMVDRLNEIANASNAIQNGDYSVKIDIKNPEDTLAISINRMTEILRVATNQAISLSQGNFEAKFNAVHDNDALGIALVGVTNALKETSDAVQEVTKGNYEATVKVKSNQDFLALALNEMITILKQTKIQEKEWVWIQEGITQLNKELSGNNTLAEVSHKAISFICEYLHAGIGAIYDYNQKTQILTQVSSYAYVQNEDSPSSFKLGEGTVGQVALQKTPIKLKNIKRTEMIVHTGISSEPPLNTYTFPLIYQDELFGVVELGSHELFDEKSAELFKLSNQIIATAIAVAEKNKRVEDLLYLSELSNKEIQKANAELEEQQQQLEEANAQMEEQQQQLEEANAQMEEQQQQLSLTSLELQEKNDILVKSKEEIDKKAKDLELSSKYKSEFLANMSHELRTPLNSIILLSDMLKNNKSEHLEEGDIKKASIIHDSGNELLRLINDVLDLSKIEAGQMEIIIDQFHSSDLSKELQDQFEHAAHQKNLKFEIIDNYNGMIANDKNRLSQVLRNLMSNALKFTKEGSVTLKINETITKEIKFSVIDTGIGVPEQKMKTIFEAFQQADGSTSREFGGTGLGLSISKELVKMMKGRLALESEVGKGSIFSVIIQNINTDLEENIDFLINRPVEKENTSYKLDDRNNMTPLDSAFLIIEDDESFASVLRDKVNEKNEYALVALNGTDGLSLANQYNIKGIFLDLGLPDIDGIDILKEFKTNWAFRKIPVYIISGMDKEKITKENGALGYAHKPISENEIIEAIDKINTFSKKRVKDLLIVEDNEIQREALKEFIGNGTVKSFGVGTIKEAIFELEKGIYDGIIIDLGLADGSGYDICEYIYKNQLHIPIIIYTGSDLSQKEEEKLRKYTDSIIIKTASSQLRLLDEVDIFMHRARIKTGKTAKNINDVDLHGKKILVVDDDIRNIYVLSEALNSKGANIITANNGKEAIEVLHQNLDTSIILMDIMMPVMNGYDATKIIKNDQNTNHIPVIAVTAKAMQDDKLNALKAGCDDYISKPLQMDILIGIIKGWLDKV